MFCFPYAGGGSRIYANWSHAVGPDVEICPVILPGHESRMAEPIAMTMERLVPQLARDLLPFLDKPYVMVGHSMGGLIAFALTEHLAGTGRSPRTLVLSGCRPQRDPHDTPRHGLPDADLLTELRTMNGTPPEFFDNPDLVDLLLPIVRSDFALAEAYEVADGQSVDVAIVALAGSDDTSTTPASIRSWRRHTTGRFQMSVVPGDHFFIHDTVRILPLILAAVTEAVE